MSFDIALSGIQAINESLDVTSHNIANAGTYGYKSNRANFSAMVTGDQSAGTHIGSNTQNIGLSGGILNTGRALDASINGRGFFVVKNANGQTQYSRVGIFDASKEGYLVDASGRKVQGFPMKPPSTILGAQGDILIPTGQIPAVASAKMQYIGNLSSDWTVPTMAWDDPANVITPATPPDTSTFNMSKASVVYDTLGGQHTLTQYFQAAAPSAGAVNVNVHYLVDGVEVQPSATGPRQMSFDATTGQLLVPDPAVDSNKFTLTGIPAAANGAIIKDIVIDYTGTTSFAGEATTSTNNVDGYASGTYSGVDLAADGSIVAKYSNGQKQAVGKIGIATFADEGALTSVSDTSWEASAGSGTALVSTAGTGMGGTLNTSSLEQSNVDITSELVGLMTSQRNYQANSKVIQTESTMLQSLMQAI